MISSFRTYIFFWYSFRLFAASSIVPVSSELCTNQPVARVRNIIWFNESQRGVTLCPKQSIHLAPWITFPTTSHAIPFIFMPNDKHFADSQLNVYLLIETDVIPSMMIDKNMIMVRTTAIKNGSMEQIHSFFVNFRLNSSVSSSLGKWIHGCPFYYIQTRNCSPVLSSTRSYKTVS